MIEMVKKARQINWQSVLRIPASDYREVLLRVDEK